MRTLLATALETVEMKNELYAMFKRVVYAPSEESYNAENLNFIEASTGVQIRQPVQIHQPLTTLLALVMPFQQCDRSPRHALLT